MGVVASAAENSTACYEMAFTIHWYDCTENFFIMVDGPYSAATGFSRFDGVVVEPIRGDGYDYEITTESSDLIIVEFYFEGGILCFVRITIGNNGLPSASVSTFYNAEVLGPHGTLYT